MAAILFYRNRKICKIMRLASVLLYKLHKRPYMICLRSFTVLEHILRIIKVIFVRDVESKTGKWRTSPTKRLFTDIASDNETSFSLSCRLAWFRECMKTPNGIVYF